jgi:hypothetical protein
VEKMIAGRCLNLKLGRRWSAVSVDDLTVEICHDGGPVFTGRVDTEILCNENGAWVDGNQVVEVADTYDLESKGLFSVPANSEDIELHLPNEAVRLFELMDSKGLVADWLWFKLSPEREVWAEAGSNGTAYLVERTAS